MSLVKVRRAAQITLPNEVRKALEVGEGDYLEAQLVAGGVLLKPVAVIERHAAWERIDELRGSIEPTPEQAAKSDDEQEREIVAEVKAARKTHAQERRRR